MNKAEIFAERMELKYGSVWKSNQGLKNRYEILLFEVSQELQETEIKETRREIQETFAGDEKALIRRKLLDELENLRLEGIDSRAKAQELFKVLKMVLKAKIKLYKDEYAKYAEALTRIKKLEKELNEKLEVAVAKTQKLQREANETIKTYNAKVLEVHTLLLELEKKRAKQEEKRQKYNLKVKDENARRGFRGV